MRSRLYASSFVDHSLSNFHAIGSFRKIDNYQASFTTCVSATLWAEKLNQDLSVNLLGTFLCSRSARLEYPRNDPLQKSLCCHSGLSNAQKTKNGNLHKIYIVYIRRFSTFAPWFAPVSFWRCKVDINGSPCTCAYSHAQTTGWPTHLPRGVQTLKGLTVIVAYYSPPGHHDDLADPSAIWSKTTIGLVWAVWLITSNPRITPLSSLWSQILVVELWIAWSGPVTFLFHPISGCCTWPRL